MMFVTFLFIKNIHSESLLATQFCESLTCIINAYNTWMTSTHFGTRNEGRASVMLYRWMLDEFEYDLTTLHQLEIWWRVEIRGNIIMSVKDFKENIVAFIKVYITWQRFSEYLNYNVQYIDWYLNVETKHLFHVQKRVTPQLLKLAYLSEILPVHLFPY